MGKIIYGVCGEGLGHATRVLTILNELRHQHEFHLFAARDAYRYLKQTIGKSDNVRVDPIPGLNFKYIFKRISYPLSITSSLPYVLSLGINTRRLEHKLQGYDADLVVTDFEPLTARLARRMGVPLISIDHQHFISELDFNHLPRGWGLRARLMSFFVQLHYGWQQRTVVSSFFSKLFQSNADVQHVGVAIRKRLQHLQPRQESFLLVYLRRFRSNRMLEMLKQRPEKFVIYGWHPAGRDGNLEFKKIDNWTFCEDLANCRALICNAGNQLIGEAHSLGKPVLAIPEAGNFEQQLNGHFLNQLGGGLSIPYRSMAKGRLDSFLESINEYRQQIDRPSANGNESIVHQIQSFFPATQQNSNTTRPYSIPA